MSQVKVPTFDTLMNPIIAALKALGGSGTIEEINAKAIEIAKVPRSQLEVLHNPDKGGQTEIEYRLSWARTYLKKCGYLENSTRGVWTLTSQGKQVDQVNPSEIKQIVKEQREKEHETQIDEALEEETGEAEWQKELFNILIDMDPSAFERLIKHLLRESGFTQVEVTGKSGDGGLMEKALCVLVGF